MKTMPILVAVVAALVLIAVYVERPQAPRGDAPTDSTAGTPEASAEAGAVTKTDAMSRTEDPMSTKVVKSEEEWRRILTPEQYHILREKGTERAFTGKYWKTKTAGTYKCAGCGLELFRSDTKFDSGCGWPSFFEPLEGARLTETEDRSFGMVRTEITCTRCGGHLGHVFTDGPKPTGLRYCINSASIDLDAKKDDAADKPAAKDGD